MQRNELNPALNPALIFWRERFAITIATSMSLRPTVLIIDDAAGTRHGLGQLLELRGYDTREARNGAHGLAMLRSEPGIRLVVLDLWMPVSDGSWFRER